ncbi:MAG TPA: hypothetical protein VJS16_05615 [Gammaproteobacteria bacterium]|nr:hypothetical protein [Gammaproteobacteria bacterium]
MSILEIIIAVLISWIIIKLVDSVWGHHKRKLILYSYPFGWTTARDDDQLRKLFTLPLGGDLRLVRLWPAMEPAEKLQWHNLVQTAKQEEERLEKEETKLSEHDRSTESGENAFLVASERFEKYQHNVRRRSEERAEAFVNAIRERLDDEARIAKYLSDGALTRFKQARQNANWLSQILGSKYLKKKRIHRNITSSGSNQT